MVGQHASFVEYPWSGLTGYNITFPVEVDTSGNAQNVVVYLRTGEALLNVNTYVTITGTVVDFNSYPPGYDTCDAVLIRRETPIEQQTDFPSYIQYGDEMEQALDRLTINMVELYDNLTEAFFPSGNSQYLQGFEPGNGSNQIPISNSGLNTSLNADLLDGSHASDIISQAVAQALEQAIPIGFVYIQMPGKPDPDTLWPSFIWSNISSEFPAHFLRIEGTYDADHVAAPFGTGVQMDALQEHTHRIEVYTVDVPFGTNEVAKDSSYDFHNDFIAKQVLNARTANETRPLNITVRIWQRTA